MINDLGNIGWEYNMVRWLERQGYDVTYSTSIDTHRPWPASKTIKAFLSVGHDEYWSAQMRTNVAAARNGGVNLGFFSANVCWWQIHFDPGERVFFVNKDNTADLWRGSVTNTSGLYPAEIELIGVEFVYNSLDANMTIVNPRPTNHWAYQYTGLTNGQILPGLLGYEVDGSWDGVAGNNINSAHPGTSTVILASSPVSYTPDTNTYLLHSYMTIYTNFSVSMVFATGSMQCN